jgi:predicted transcriptional regulator
VIRRRDGIERPASRCARPLTVSEVQADLGEELAHTTVMTTLSRLHAKGALTRKLAGRAYALPADPAAAGASVTARRMSRLLNSGQDRADALARFVAGLSPEDERLLAQLLGEGGRNGEERPCPPRCVCRWWPACERRSEHARHGTRPPHTSTGLPIVTVRSTGSPK